MAFAVGRSVVCQSVPLHLRDGRRLLVVNIPLLYAEDAGIYCYGGRRLTRLSKHHQLAGRTDVASLMYSHNALSRSLSLLVGRATAAAAVSS